MCYPRGVKRWRAKAQNAGDARTPRACDKAATAASAEIPLMHLPLRSTQLQVVGGPVHVFS